VSRLADQIQQVLPVFSELETPPALIDGLALAAHQVIRATRDIDFLVAAVDADRVHGLLLTLGYRCVHRRKNGVRFTYPLAFLELTGRCAAWKAQAKAASLPKARPRRFL
jgi:hypothetical protein